MRLLPLTSSQLAAIGYNAGSRVMAVQFQKGEGLYYVYEDVPPDAFVRVITDEESQGRAFHQIIKQGGFTYRRVAPEEIHKL